MPGRTYLDIYYEKEIIQVKAISSSHIAVVNNDKQSNKYEVDIFEHNSAEINA